MYDKKDPRSQLAAGSTMDLSSPLKAPTYIEFDYSVPADRDESQTTWVARGTNFSLAYSRLSPGATLEREQNEEYVVIMPNRDSRLTVIAGDETQDVSGQAIVVVPPGKSKITANDGSDVVRLFDARTRDMLDQAANAAEFAEPNARIPELLVGEVPVGGDRLRVYPVGDIAPAEGRFGRIFRTRAFMVNFLYPFDGPRSRHQLSPHHHNHFEQCSLAVGGQFEHHIRTPWATDMDRWREDDHVVVGSPSMTLIPPPTIHTTRACGANENQLIDIFSPPRVDFSAKEGWVLNDDEFPLNREIGHD